MIRTALVAALLTSMASPVFAQGPYVSASIGEDILRVPASPMAALRNPRGTPRWPRRRGCVSR